MSQSTADMPQLEKGRMYHIGLERGEVAPFILLCGDPARVEKTAAFLDEKNKAICHREYVTVTGKYKGIPVSVMSTGMGPDNTEIALVELSQIVSQPTFIRIGTSGALQPDIKIGDMIISSGALRLENTSTFFVHEGYPAVASHEAVLALLASVNKLKLKYYVGVTATAPGFYGAQGRKIPFFPPRDPEILNKLEAMKILNLEMESSTLFSMSSLAGFRAGTICVVIAERTANKFIDKDTLEQAEINCLKAGLGAVEILAKMDKARGNAEYWLPSMGL